MTVTDGARGDDKRNSSALSTEDYFVLFVCIQFVFDLFLHFSILVFVFVFIFVLGNGIRSLSALSTKHYFVVSVCG